VASRASDHRGATSNPTWGARRVSLSDVAMFLAGDLLDERALEELIFGCTWVTMREADTRARSDDSPPLSRAYALLRLLFLPKGIPHGAEQTRIVLDPAIVSLLRAGRVSDAIEVACRQLAAKHFRPRRVIEDDVQDAALGRRIAAALLIPTWDTRSLLERALLPATESSSSENTHDEENVHVR